MNVGLAIVYVLTAFLIFSSLYFGLRMFKLSRRRNVRVTAKIIANDSNIRKHSHYRHSSGSTFLIVYEFNAEGKDYGRRVIVSHHDYKLPIGSEIDVVYEQGNPRNSDLAKHKYDWCKPVAFAVVLIVVTIVATLNSIYGGV